MDRSLPCPDCGTPLPQPVTAVCPHCALRLSGPLASRLWVLDQELASLESRRAEIDEERRSLIAALHVPPGASPVVPGPPVPGRTLSVQQVLLGLGALLLLSALGFLGLVMWLVVGIWGQAAILLLVTAASGVATILFNRRGLPAAAETFGLMTAGLLLMDAVAARSFGLLGLDEWSFGFFWALASATAAVLLLLVDRYAGESPRRLVSVRPIASLAAVGVPWLLATTADPDDLGVPVLLGLIALADAAIGAAILRRFQRGGRRVTSPSVAVAGIGTALAAIGYEVSALVMAYDLDGDVALRYQAWALALMPVVVLGVVWVRTASEVVGTAFAVGALVLAGVPFLDAPWWSLPLVALAAAVVLLAVPSLVVRMVALVLGAATYPALLVLTIEDSHTVREVLLGTGGATAVPALAAIATALIGAVVCALLGWRERADGFSRTASVAGVVVSIFAAELAFLLERGDTWWYATGLTDVVVLGLVAALVRLRGGEPAFAIELTLAAALAGAAVVTYGFALRLDDDAAGMHLVILTGVLGLGGLLYALLPERFGLSYLGSAFTSIAWWIFLAARDADLPVELYSLPAAALVALVGLAQAWRFRRQGSAAPSLLVAGPALSVALLPSVQVALAGDGAVRLGLVTLVAVGLVLVGVLTRTQAPMLVGGVAVLEIALLQGGPYVGGLPFWLTGGVAGVILLVAGVRWEATVATGKRSAAWFESLG